MMDKIEALKLLSRYRTNEIVLTTMTTSWIWPRITHNPDLDCACYGIMAQGASIGLGVALGRPDKKVLILNGDGSQMMHLGSIASIANADARNVVLFVVQNDQYEMTGGQPIPVAGRVDFAAVARGLGMRHGHSFGDLSEFEAKLPEILKQEGPTLVALRVTAGEISDPAKPKLKEEVHRLKSVLARTP